MTSTISLKSATFSTVFLNPLFSTYGFSPFWKLTFGQRFPLSCPVQICLPRLPVLYLSPPRSLLLLLPLPFLRMSGRQLSTTEHTRALPVADHFHTYRISGGD